jgi:hypothetical protein
MNTRNAVVVNAHLRRKFAADEDRRVARAGGIGVIAHPNG